jgi:hypothetical protein
MYMRETGGREGEGEKEYFILVRSNFNHESVNRFSGAIFPFREDTPRRESI